jgi:3-oxoacyl-[acyl-carrier-protein] synthase II
LLLNGRAWTVLCAAAEEYTTARAWLDHHGRGGEPGLLGEGAVALSVQLDEPPGPHASLLAVESGLLLPDADSAGLVTGLVCRALDRAGLTAAQVWAAVPSGFHPGETRALADLFGAGALDRVPATAELLGDTAAVSAMFQLAAAMASADDAAGRVVVLTSVDIDGMAAAAVLRLQEGAS